MTTEMDLYPANDVQFEETTISAVTESDSGGWSIKRADGWSFWIQADSPVTPKVGMAARFYGTGIGGTVRGLFLDGVKVFYRTEDEDKEKYEIDAYGADAADWLKKWDDGKSVWSIEMGGLGPGYEQCIQITCAEMVRHMLHKGYKTEAWQNEGAWKQVRNEIDSAMSDNQAVVKLGLSGAQFGAALSLAVWLYRDGPRAVMKHPAIKDRHIQVSKYFPGA
jgi:hypothetical protein